MVNLRIERLWPALPLRKELNDPASGIEDHRHAQQAIQPNSAPTPCHRFERYLEEAGRFGFGLHRIVPTRILFR
jgi:hypothetical protein